MGDHINVNVASSSGLTIVGGTHMHRAPPDTEVQPTENLNQPISWNDLHTIIDSVEDDGSKLESLKNILVASTIKELTCTLTTSKLSMEIQSVSSSQLRIYIDQVWRNCAPELQLMKFPSQPVKASNGNSLYCLKFSLVNNSASELTNHLISSIYPEYDGISRFMDLAKFVAEHVHVDPSSKPVIKFYISYALSDDFCQAIKALSFDNLGSISLQCLHYPYDLDKVYERTECIVEQIGSAVLSKRNISLDCIVYHPLRQDQLTEFLLKEYGEGYRLSMFYARHQIERKFFKNKRNKKQLKNTDFLDIQGRFVIALRPGKTYINRVGANYLKKNVLDELNSPDYRWKYVLDSKAKSPRSRCAIL